MLQAVLLCILLSATLVLLGPLSEHPRRIIYRAITPSKPLISCSAELCACSCHGKPPWAVLMVQRLLVTFDNNVFSYRSQEEQVGFGYEVVERHKLGLIKKEWDSAVDVRLLLCCLSRSLGL